jgi:hypothetical protein
MIAHGAANAKAKPPSLPILEESPKLAGNDFPFLGSFGETRRTVGQSTGPP